MNFNRDKILAFLNKIEPFYFYLFVIINVLPVIVFKFFLVVDGPAHLYNSRLILELLNNNNFLSDYFNFNHISPNWFGHIVLVIFLKVFPAFMAEKILILIYLIGFPLSFRALIKSLPFKNTTMFYFVFPFTYSFLFYLGMYNFHLGLVFFFLALALFIRYKEQYNLKRIIILLFLSALICLSHLFTFFIFILIIFIFNLHPLKSLFSSDSKTKSLIFKKIATQLLFLSVGIILMVNFFLTNAGNTGNNLIYLSPWKLLNWIIEMQPAKGISYGKASIFTRWIFFSFLLILSYLAGKKLYHLWIHKKQENKLQTHSSNNYWLYLSIISIALLFILPDGNSSFGFISSRLVLFFFLFIIIWLSTQYLPTWLKIITFLVINYMNFALLKIYFTSAKNTNNISLAICEATDHIEPNSVVLPFNYSDNMLFTHASNYLGIEKPMVILDNYEATLNYFPLKWNIKSIPDLLLPNQSFADSCVNFPKNKQNKKKNIDYIFMITDKNKDMPSQCKTEVENLLNSSFKLEYANADKTVQLYRYVVQ